MRCWPRFVIGAAVAAILAFSIHRNPSSGAKILPNSCLVFANEYENALLAKRVMTHVQWTRIVGVTRLYWFRQPTGHALCVFALRNGDVWAYDTLDGSRPLGTRSHDLNVIGERLHAQDPHDYLAKWLD